MRKNAKYRFIPCWYEESSDEIFGKNWIYHIIFKLFLWFDIFILLKIELPIWIDENQQ